MAKTTNIIIRIDKDCINLFRKNNVDENKPKRLINMPRESIRKSHIKVYLGKMAKNLGYSAFKHEDEFKSELGEYKPL